MSNTTWMLAVGGLLAVAAFLNQPRRRRRGKREGKHGQPFTFGGPSKSNEEGTDLYEVWKGDAANENAAEAKAEPRKKYRDKFRLLNGAEIALYRRLTEAAPALLVFTQVSMSQVFHINGRTKDGYRQLGEIGRKSIDFLLCRPDDTSIVVAIELNGPTHDAPKQQASDEKKRAALEEAGIPLLVLTPDPLPDVLALRKAIAPHIVDRKRYEAERDERLQR